VIHVFLTYNNQFSRVSFGCETGTSHYPITLRFALLTTSDYTLFMWPFHTLFRSAQKLISTVIATFAVWELPHNTKNIAHYGNLHNFNYSHIPLTSL
jgi:hypothetical protein